MMRIRRDTFNNLRKVGEIAGIGERQTQHAPALLLMLLFSFILLLPFQAVSAAPSADIKTQQYRQEKILPLLDDGVMDYAGLLSPTEKAKINRKIWALEKNSGSQLAVLILPDLQGHEIVEYGVTIMEEWQLGRKGVDDGVLLLIALQERAMRIEVGYGLEGAIPDLIAGQILNQYLTPAFRAGKFAEGIELAVDAIIAQIEGEPLPSLKEVPLSASSNHEELVDWDLAFTIIVMVVMIIAPFLLPIIRRLQQRSRRVSNEQKGALFESREPHNSPINHSSDLQQDSLKTWADHYRSQNQKRSYSSREPSIPSSKRESRHTSSKKVKKISWMEAFFRSLPSAIFIGFFYLYRISSCDWDLDRTSSPTLSNCGPCARFYSCAD